VGERGIDSNTLEYRHRRAAENEEISLTGAVETILARLQSR
jgi:hypothetical protein